MKKKINIVLFSGLAVIFVLMVVGVLFWFADYDNDRPRHKKIDDADETEKVETRELEAFDAIDSEGVCDIEFVQSDRSAVEITAASNKINFIETNVDDGKLKISANLVNKRNHHPKVIVYSPSCKFIKNEGVGSITCDSLSTGTLRIVNEGVGDIIVNKLTTTKLKIESEGIGGITVCGAIENARLEKEGVGTIDLTCSECGEVNASNDGVGAIIVSGVAQHAQLDNEGVGRIDASYLECDDVNVSNEGLGEVVTKKE